MNAKIKVTKLTLFWLIAISSTFYGDARGQDSNKEAIAGVIPDQASSCESFRHVIDTALVESQENRSLVFFIIRSAKDERSNHILKNRLQQITSHIESRAALDHSIVAHADKNSLKFGSLEIYVNNELYATLYFLRNNRKKICR